MAHHSGKTSELHPNEEIKTSSNFLRGTILEGLADIATGAISEKDSQLTKFHGIYQQDDRDVRKERRKQKLEKAFSFMIRVRVPGGVCTPAQWLEMDRIADEYANGTLKITTRQALQFHGVIKSNLKTTIREINDSLLDTIAACGDVNRNVMCNPNPYESAVHAPVQKIADAISARLTPQTRAYHEIWLNGEKVESSEADASEEVEPIYGKTYLPRKFKIAIAIPPANDVDVFAHCIGLIAIVEDGNLKGFNITVGGGMGMTHGKQATFPRTGEVMAFCTPDQAVDVCEKIVTVQRDHGDRVDRSHARFKYTVEDLGLARIRELVEERLGYTLDDPRAFLFEHTGDRYGWIQGADGNWHLTLFIQNGRVKDTDGLPMKTGLAEIAKIHTGDFRLTANQNLVISQIPPADKEKIERLAKRYNLDQFDRVSGLRRNAMACVALPTCGLAISESERFLPHLLDRLDEVLDEAGLREEAIVIRSTGCPNGCARPYLAEVGLVGKAPGKYNLYLGAAFDGSRLNKLYRENATEDEIVETLKPLFEHYAREGHDNERFGDFCIRAGYVKATHAGRDFHKDIQLVN